MLKLWAIATQSNLDSDPDLGCALMNHHLEPSSNGVADQPKRFASQATVPPMPQSDCRLRSVEPSDAELEYQPHS